MSLEFEGGVKKLVLVLATSTPVTETSEEVVRTTKAVETAETGKDGSEYHNFAQVPCIRYPINFRKQSVSALFDLGSEVHAVHPAFAKELSLPIRPTDVGTQKIDGTTPETYGMVVAAFLLEDKANWVKLFEETFLMANVSPEVGLGMSFLTLSGADVDFLGHELWWRTYTTKKALPTTKRVELVGKKEFAAATLDPEYETYVVHIRLASSDMLPNFFTSQLELDIHPFWRPQIFGLIAEEAPTKIPAKYSDFADVFFPDLTSEFFKHTGINNYAIELIECQQPPNRLIYSLGPVELDTLKT